MKTRQMPLIHECPRSVPCHRAIRPNRLGFASSLALFWLLGFGPSIAGASTFIVTTTADTIANDGELSLREAIDLANGASDEDVIEFAPSMTGVITLTAGQITVTEKLTINGPGPSQLAIDGNASSRIFAIYNTTASITGLTIRNGREPADFGGGAILVLDLSGGNDISVLLELSNCAFTGNRASEGGAIYINGSLLVDSCTFDDNQTVQASGCHGGAIYFRSDPDFPTCTNDGGVRTCEGVVDQRLVINSSTFTRNRVPGMYSEGGAIYIDEDLETYFPEDHEVLISNSTFSSGNHAGSFGGAIWLGCGAPATIVNTTFSLGTAGARGGGHL